MFVDTVAFLLCFPLEKELDRNYLDHILHATVVRVEQKENEECYWVTIDKQT